MTLKNVIAQFKRVASQSRQNPTPACFGDWILGQFIVARVETGEAKGVAEIELIEVSYPEKITVTIRIES